MGVSNRQNGHALNSWINKKRLLTSLNGNILKYFKLHFYLKLIYLLIDVKYIVSLLQLELFYFSHEWLIVSI